MRNVFFHPWVGENYGTDNSIFKSKILILGNSHYCEACDDCGDLELHPECANLTRQVVSDYLDPAHVAKWKKTFSTFINSMLNKDSSIGDRIAFFSSIAFYNYLQVSAGEDAYSTSSYYYTENNHLRAFYEVIDEISPDIVICWGSKLWDILPDNWDGHGEAEKGAGIYIGTTVFKKYYNYPYRAGKKIMLIGVRHPSLGYDINYHHNILSQLISL